MIVKSRSSSGLIRKPIASYADVRHDAPQPLSDVTVEIVSYTVSASDCTLTNLSSL
jgi:hypothetical protein